MLGFADDEYVNLTDRPEPANEVRPGKPWRMLQLGERGHAAKATQQSVVAQRAVQPSVAASQTGTQPAIAEGGPRQRLSLRASKLKTWQERRKFQIEYLAQKLPDPDEDSSGSEAIAEGGPSQRWPRNKPKYRRNWSKGPLTSSRRTFLAHPKDSGVGGCSGPSREDRPTERRLGTDGSNGAKNPARNTLGGDTRSGPR